MSTINTTLVEDAALARLISQMPALLTAEEDEFNALHDEMGNTELSLTPIARWLREHPVKENAVQQDEPTIIVEAQDMSQPLAEYEKNGIYEFQFLFTILLAGIDTFKQTFGTTELTWTPQETLKVKLSAYASALVTCFERICQGREHLTFDAFGNTNEAVATLSLQTVTYSPSLQSEDDETLFLRFVEIGYEGTIEHRAI